MAPEQLEGGKVSPATDIYAFGLLLYEMVTGVRTFPSNGLLSGIAQRLRGKLPSARAILPEIPQSWEIAIEGSLRLDPEERFQKASGVIQAIEGNLTSLSQLNIASYQAKLKARSRPEWLTRRTVIVWSMIFAVVMALLAFFFRQYSLEADSRVATGAKVYLTPIRNETGEKSLDNVTELIQAGLAQSAQIDLLDQGAVGDTLQGMTKSPDTVPDARTAREIAMRTGAARVVFAALSGSGGNYRLDIDVQQPASTPTRYRQDWNESFPWQSKGSLGTSSTLPPELLIAVRKANDWIRKTVGESSNDIARLDAPPEDVTTDNWQALSEYATAEQLQRHQQTESAIQALQNAIQLDPQFSLAYARLGDHLVGLGRYRDGYLAYQRALDTDQQRRLSRRQRDQIRGIYALDSNDFEAAEAAFRDSTIYFPNDYSGWFDRGYPLMMLGRTDEAIATLKHAYQIDQTRLSAPFELANAYISLGQWSNASEWLDIAKKHNRAESVADAEGISLFLQGRFAEAEKQFQLLIQSPRQEDHRLGYSLLSRLYAEQGKKADALGTLGDAIAIHLNTHSAAQATSDFLDRAYLECQYGEFDPCLKDVEAALDLDRSPQSAIEASAILGRAFPQLSGKRAHHCLALLHGLISDQSYDGFGTIGDLARLRVEGETLLASGQWQKALASFEQADKLDAPVNEREYIARAFEEAANHEPVLNTARLLRLEALEAYGRVALHPNTAWQYAEKWKPGFYADQLSAYLRLAAMTGTRNRDTEAALQRYRALRPIDSRVLNPTEQTRN
jgi:tetratricopeptide (TPR) repeat protein